MAVEAVLKQRLLIRYIFTEFTVVRLLFYVKHVTIYYIDMSVFPKNRQLVFSIRNYIRDKSEMLVYSLVKISLTSFLCFSSIFFFNFRNTHIYVIKRKLRSLVKYFSPSKIILILSSRHRLRSSVYLLTDVTLGHSKLIN